MATACCSILACSNLAACTPSVQDEQAIRALLSEREQALHERAPERLQAIISPAYQDKGLTAPAKIADISRTLASWDSIDMISDKPVITISGNTASVKQVYRLRVSKAGKQLQLNGEEELRLRREQNSWKIISGL